MTPGDVVLARMPQVAGVAPKLRPTLLLATLLGPYQNLLLCGISTQLHQLQANWDELLDPADADFPSSGLRAASVIRLSFLWAAETADTHGVIGRIDPLRLERLRRRLADHLRP